MTHLDQNFSKAKGEVYLSDRSWGGRQPGKQQKVRRACPSRKMGELYDQRGRSEKNYLITEKISADTRFN